MKAQHQLYELFRLRMGKYFSILFHHHPQSVLTDDSYMASLEQLLSAIEYLWPHVSKSGGIL